MEHKLISLLSTLENKGFYSFEIPVLIGDVVSIFHHEMFDSVSTINEELEDLGWGINVMDHDLYDLFTTLIQRDSFKQRQLALFPSFS